LKSKVLNIILPHLYTLAEKYIEKYFDIFAFVSEADKLASQIDQEKSLSGESRDHPILPSSKTRSADVVIFGRWSHPPNRDGLARILFNLKDINGKVLLLGPDLPKDIHVPDNVYIQGFTEDISTVMSDAKLCLIPVWYGAGLQNKVFDALKYGCKVITTEFTVHNMAMNNFHSKSMVPALDIIKEINTSLFNYSEKDAVDAYDTYSRFYNQATKQTDKYVQKVAVLCESRRVKI